MNPGGFKTETQECVNESKRKIDGSWPAIKGLGVALEFIEVALQPVAVPPHLQPVPYQRRRALSSIA
jgi:hypothetical protein